MPAKETSLSAQPCSADAVGTAKEVYRARGIKKQVAVRAMPSACLAQHMSVLCKPDAMPLQLLCWLILLFCIQGAVPPWPAHAAKALGCTRLKPRRGGESGLRRKYMPRIPRLNGTTFIYGYACRPYGPRPWWSTLNQKVSCYGITPQHVSSSHLAASTMLACLAGHSSPDVLASLAPET